MAMPNTLRWFKESSGVACYWDGFLVLVLELHRCAFLGDEKLQCLLKRGVSLADGTMGSKVARYLTRYMDQSREKKSLKG